jgi:hypothetical protein
MSHSLGGSGEVSDQFDRNKYKRLIGRAFREKWEIPKDVRRRAMNSLGKTIDDPAVGVRERTAAVKALLAASKTNLASISATIKAVQFIEYEVRLAQIEKVLNEDEDEDNDEGDGPPARESTC